MRPNRRHASRATARIAAALVAAAAIGAERAPAAVIVVDAAMGPGAHTASISAGVAMAQDGDVLLVRAGTYGPFLLDKGLTVQADQGATVLVDGTIEVFSILPQQSAVIRGLRTGQTSVGKRGLKIHSCYGPVLVEACTVTAGIGGSTSAGGIPPGTEIIDSPQVTLVRVTSNGGNTGSFPNNHGGPGLFAKTSTVAVYDSVMTGGYGGFHDDIGGTGGDGARLSYATLIASGTEFRGGSGGGADDDFDHFCNCIICGWTGPGGNGVAVEWSSLGNARLFDCMLVPGPGGFSTSVAGCPNGPPGVPLQGPGSFAQPVGTSRALRVSSPLREGGAGSLKAVGLPGDSLLLTIGLKPALLQAPPYENTLLTAPLTVAVIGSLGASGSLTLPLTGPTLPAGVDAATAVVQGIFLGGAQPVPGSGSGVVILDSSF